MDTNLTPGTRVERYEIEGLLGEGGTASVYRVRHTALGTRHALKVLRRPSIGVQRRLLLEGRVQAHLRHQNIVAVTDVIQLQLGTGLVLDLVDGPTLATMLERERLSIPGADAVADGLFRGIAFAHDQGLVHRDLKPENVLLERLGEQVVPKVTDFGLVKLSDDQPERPLGRTMGTPRYMAPEQIRDTERVDHRADVWALGCILYAMVTGRPAFSPDDDDLFSIFDAIDRGRYAPVRSLRPETPPRMVAAIDAALQVERDDRPRSVHALRDLWRGTCTPPLPRRSLEGLAARVSASPIDTLLPTPSRSTRPTEEPHATGLGTGMALFGTSALVGATAAFTLARWYLGG